MCNLGKTCIMFVVDRKKFKVLLPILELKEFKRNESPYVYLTFVKSLIKNRFLLSPHPGGKTVNNVQPEK